MEEHECNDVVEFETDYDGAGLEDIDNINSWQECAGLCNQNKDCKKWTWGDSNFTHPFRCFLKDGNSTSVLKKDNLFSGIRCRTGQVKLRYETINH